MENINDIMANMVSNDSFGYDPKEDEDNTDVNTDPSLIAGHIPVDALPKSKCKWCGKLVDRAFKLDHEEDCSSNDGGREDMNIEMICQKYFD